MLHGMVRLELYNTFGVDHDVPRYSYEGQEGRKEESKEFRLGGTDVLDRATVGLRLQQFVAQEHLNDMVEIGRLEKEAVETEA